MMNDRTYHTFSEFYPYYLREHSNKTNRILHFIGTFIVIILLFVSIILHKYQLLAIMPIAGYGFAWFGHFNFEKNKPATFKYPIWSLISDFLMFYHICTGQIGRKLEQAKEK